MRTPSRRSPGRLFNHYLYPCAVSAASTTKDYYTLCACSRPRRPTNTAAVASMAPHATAATTAVLGCRNHEAPHSSSDDDDDVLPAGGDVRKLSARCRRMRPVWRCAWLMLQMRVNHRGAACNCTAARPGRLTCCLVLGCLVRCVRPPWGSRGLLPHRLYAPQRGHIARPQLHGHHLHVPQHLQEAVQLLLCAARRTSRSKGRM